MVSTVFREWPRVIPNRDGAILSLAKCLSKTLTGRRWVTECSGRKQPVIRTLQAGITLASLKSSEVQPTQVVQTTSAANQHGAIESERHRGKLTDIRSFWLRLAPFNPESLLQETGTRTETAMSITETLAEESRTHIISSITNLVCPTCGSAMLGFQCHGRCRRNWASEWRWANGATVGSEVR